jgi:hypothetical protein
MKVMKKKRKKRGPELMVSNPEYVSIADLFEALAKKVPNLPPEDILNQYVHTWSVSGR